MAKTCHCKKSRCLKLYCECFAAGMYCGGTCACLSCSNRVECADEVLERRSQIISRDPEAFTNKVGVGVR